MHGQHIISLHTKDAFKIFIIQNIFVQKL